MPADARSLALAAFALIPLACGGSSDGAATGDGGVDATTFDAAPSGEEAATGASEDSGLADADGGPVVGASVTVDPAKPLGTIGPGFVGLSYEKSHLEAGLFRADNAPLVALFKLLGPSVLRVGGNSVDTSVWQAFDAGPPVGDAAAPSVVTGADVDALAAFVKAAGWTVIYGVNLKLSSIEAADLEAEYASTALGSALYGFEIGNEPDLYPDAGIASQPGPWNLAAFENAWDSFASAMHAGAPGSPMTGPADATHYAAWTVPFAKDQAPALEVLTQHYYVANGLLATSTMDRLLSPDPALATELQALAGAAESNGIAMRYRLAECNSFSNGGAPGVSDAYGSALWAIDFLFANAQYGSTGVNFHGGGNGAGYTPIADAKGSVVEARPMFYGMLLFATAGQGTLYGTTGSTTSPNFSAYALGNAGTTTRVVLSNKDAVTTVHATVDVGATLASAEALRLRGPSLAATTGVTFRGASVLADGSFAPKPPESVVTSGSTFTIDVPPASAVLVSVQ